MVLWLPQHIHVYTHHTMCVCIYVYIYIYIYIIILYYVSSICICICFCKIFRRERERDTHRDTQTHRDRLRISLRALVSTQQDAESGKPSIRVACGPKKVFLTASGESGRQHSGSMAFGITRSIDSHLGASKSSRGMRPGPGRVPAAEAA